MSNQQSDEQSNRRPGKQSYPAEAGGRLRRALSVWGASAFVITSMIGTGIFTVPAEVRASTGNGVAALGVWATGAALALFGAFCYAELATRMPRAGGEYQYLSHVYGRPWGFIGGWITFFAGFAAPIAASAIKAIDYFSPLAPGWNPNAPLIEGLGVTQGAAVAALLPLLLALPHSIGVKPSGRLQTTLALMTVTAIIVFTTAGLSSGRGEWGRVIQGSETAGAWWVALIQCTFAYLGWNAAAYLAGEVTEPRRTLPRALISGTLVVTVLYLALNVLYFYAIRTDDWKSMIAPGQKKATDTVGHIAAVGIFGDSGGMLVSAIITIIIIGAISAWTALGPRIYYAMARDGLAPSIFGRLGKRSQAPIIAILTQAGIASVMALISPFRELLLYVGSALMLISALTVAAVYVVRRSKDDDPKSNFSVPGYPYTPAVYILLVILAWIQTIQNEPMPAVYVIVTVAVGVGVYYVCRALGWIAATSKTRPKTETLETDQ